MTYVYTALSLLTTLGGAAAYLYRRYRKSLGKHSQTFRSYLVGTVKLRLGALFSKVLAGQLAAKRYAEISLACFPSKLSIPSAQNVQLDLDSSYIRLVLTTGTQEKVADSSLLAWSSRSAHSVLIFGEPGSGKSTLTRKLFRETCSRLYRSPNRSPLPVHIELRTLGWSELTDKGKSGGDWLLSKVNSKVDSIKGVYSDGFIFPAFSSGQGVVLFLDGLDEVPSGHLAAAQSEIGGLLRDLGSRGANRTTVIVTGRSQLRTTLGRAFLDGFKEIATIAPFTPADVFAFLQRWRFPSHRRAEAARIFKVIQANRSLQEMCTNPLVLSMYVARDQFYMERSGSRPIRLPDTRTDFYQEIVNELLLFRRGEQVVGAPVGSQLKRQRETVLGRIALDHLLDADQPANSIPWGLAVDHFRDVFNLPSIDRAEARLRELAIETGIYAEERRAETIRFMHLTLCEFLAALELRELEPSKLREVTVAAREDGTVDRLAEVIVFGALLAGRAVRADIVKALAANLSTVIIALRIVTETHDISRQLIKRVIDGTLSLSLNGWAHEVETRQRLLYLCVAKLSQLNNESPIEAQNRLVRLVEKQVDCEGPITFSGIFKTFLQVHPDAAVAEAKRRDQHELLAPALLARSLEDPDVIHRAIASFKTDPETWGLALAEAALRYTLVADILIGEPLDDETSAVSTGRWANVSRLNGTVYGQVLNFATSLPENDPRLADLLKVPILIRFVNDLLNEKNDFYMRICLNLGGRFSFGLTGAPSLYDIVDGDGRSVWGPPALLEVAPTTDRGYLKDHSEFEILSFDDPSLIDSGAYLAAILISIDEPLVRLPNITSARWLSDRAHGSWIRNMRRRLSRIVRRQVKTSGFAWYTERAE